MVQQMPCPSPLAPFPTAKQLTEALLLQTEDEPGKLELEEIPVSVFQDWDPCTLMPIPLLFSFESHMLRVIHVQPSFSSPPAETNPWI